MRHALDFSMNSMRASQVKSICSSDMLLKSGSRIKESAAKDEFWVSKFSTLNFLLPCEVAKF